MRGLAGGMDGVGVKLSVLQVALKIDFPPSSSPPSISWSAPRVSSKLEVLDQHLNFKVNFFTNQNGCVSSIIHPEVHF